MQGRDGQRKGLVHGVALQDSETHMVLDYRGPGRWSSVGTCPSSDATSSELCTCLLTPYTELKPSGHVQGNEGKIGPLLGDGRAGRRVLLSPVTAPSTSYLSTD